MLKALIQTLDRTSDLSKVSAILAQFPLSVSDLKTWVAFDPHQYSRQPIHKTSTYEIWCFCWLPGQCSPIHDHLGSKTLVHVISGEATEYIYEKYGGKARHINTRTLPVGTAYEEEADIHCLGNAATSFENLITLHIYAPPPLIPLDSTFLGGRVYEEQL